MLESTVPGRAEGEATDADSQPALLPMLAAQESPNMTGTTLWLIVLLSPVTRDNSLLLIGRVLGKFVLASFTVALLRSSAPAVALLPSGSLTLAWDPNPDPSVVGYRLYQGGRSQVYTSVVDVGTNPTVAISGLVAGVTYYFAVTAYDSSGLESAFSSEISYTMPTRAPPPPPPSMLARLSIAQTGAGQVRLTGTGPAGAVYDVLATQDFCSWLVLGSVTVDLAGSFQFTDRPSVIVPLRYYRLRQFTPPPTTP